MTSESSASPAELAALERRLLEQENRELRAELEQANTALREVERLKTDFLSMVSHELRTPLTAILGYTDLLLRGTHGDLNDRQLRHQTAVKHGAQRLLMLINDLLDVSRLDSGLVELEVSEFTLADLLEQAVAGIRDLASSSGLTLRVEQPADPPTIRGDRARLLQVLANLLANAVKFTPSSGRIDIWAEWVDDGSVKICVRDSGAGIAGEHLAHIWERFYQADSSVRRRYGGTGLGLAIVRSLVELHGGRVWADSSGLGTGATFCFAIPPYRIASIRTAAPPAQPLTATATVLVVEDEPDNRELIATMLEEMLDVKVIAAADGLEALEKAEALPDLILLDLMLPKLDGFQVVRRLKAAESTRHIPVLALTALAREAEREEALAAGCDGVVVKPFDTETLINTVAERIRLDSTR